MSNVKRIELREAYMQGWYQMDGDMLLATTSTDFIFDDPAEPQPITRDALAAYMQRWDQRIRALGGDNQWVLTHHTRVDADGILTDWEWWQLPAASLQGAAVVLTGNDGVLLERITYFERESRHPSIP